MTILVIKTLGKFEIYPSNYLLIVEHTFFVLNLLCYIVCSAVKSLMCMLCEYVVHLTVTFICIKHVFCLKNNFFYKNVEINMFLLVRYLLYDMFITNECRLNIMVRGTGRAWEWLVYGDGSTHVPAPGSIVRLCNVKSRWL